MQHSVVIAAIFTEFRYVAIYRLSLNSSAEPRRLKAKVRVCSCNSANGVYGGMPKRRSAKLIFSTNKNGSNRNKANHRNGGMIVSQRRIGHARQDNPFMMATPWRCHPTTTRIPLHPDPVRRLGPASGWAHWPP